MNIKKTKKGGSYIGNGFEYFMDKRKLKFVIS